MSSAVFRLCDDHVTRAVAADPVSATYYGVPGYDDQPTDYSPDGVARRVEVRRETLRRLDGLPVETPADRLAAAHLRERLETDLAWYDAGEAFRELHVFGPMVGLRSSFELMAHETPEQWEAVAARLASVPQMLAGQRASLQAGWETPAARRQALAAAQQARTYAEGAHERLVQAYGDGPLRARLEQAAAAAHAAYAETARWLEEEYAPRAAERDGVGAERYAVASRVYLGAEVDLQEAYAWGWEELHRLEDEMAREADRVLPGATVAEASAHLDRTDLVEGAEAYRAWLQEQHDAALEALDGVHFAVDPRIKRVEVRLAPEGSAAAPYYTAPSEDLSRPGRTWWPALGRSTFAVWDELTTVFHEGVPGHHLQLGQAKVAPLSRFARNSFVSGHGEGWALYAERFADELGWFPTPGRRLGMLTGSAFRAARVVIDIGVHLDLPLPPAEAERHGPRWTYDNAAVVLRDRGRLQAHMVDSEVVRYFGLPGQAPAYKLGERMWVAARAEAQQRLGPAFDLKAWHTAALDLGPLGLDTMVEQLRAWSP